MSEDRPVITEASVAAQRKMYEDPNGIFQQSGRGAEYLRDHDVRVAELRLRGVLPVEPPKVLDPMAQARQNVLARDFPELKPSPDIVTTAHSARFDELDAMPADRQSRLAAEVAKEFHDYPRAEDGYSRYDPATGTYATGAEVVDRLVEDARPSVYAEAEDAETAAEIMKLIRLDAKILRYHAARGRHMTRIADGRRKLGAKS